MRRFPYQPKKDKKEQKANVLAAPQVFMKLSEKDLHFLKTHGRNAHAQAQQPRTPPANCTSHTQGSGVPSKITGTFFCLFHSSKVFPAK